MPDIIGAAKVPHAVWLVTGCSSGFGRAISAVLFARGTPLVATARDQTALGHLPDGLANLLKVALDVARPDTIKSALDAAMDRFGRIDGVVNNAGIGVIGPVHAQTREPFENRCPDKR